MGSLRRFFGFLIPSDPARPPTLLHRVYYALNRSSARGRPTLAGHLVEALLRPSRPTRPTLALRELLRTPRLFALISYAIQVRDMGRVEMARTAYAVTDSHHRKVHDYNLGTIRKKRIVTTRRTEDLYPILALPSRDISDEKVLVIGCRDVLELFVAWLHGFSWKNISGLDLFSTNRKIIAMNMEAMTFPDGTFDSVAMGNTLAYAKDARAALSEVARILRPGGRFVFNHGYRGPTKGTDYPQDSVTGAEIRDTLSSLGLEIYFYHAHDRTIRDGRPQTSHFFGVRKPIEGERRLDHLSL